MTRIGDAVVHGIGLGTAPFAFRDGTREQSIATVHAAIDAGVRLIDTAVAYTRLGHDSYAEEIIAAALRDRRSERPLIATKGGHYRLNDRFPVDGRPASLRAHCELSLRTLGVEQIDLYQLHHVDPNVAIEESVVTLRELQMSGKIAGIGLSNVDRSLLDRALAIAPVVTVQNRLSHGAQEDLSMVRACEDRGIAYLAYMPFGGRLGRPAAAVERVAARRGVSAQRVQIAWLRAQSTNVVPLAGASRPASIIDSAALISLTADELTELAV